MGRVVITSVEDVPIRDFPPFAGVTGVGNLQTRGVIDGPDRPLLFWLHELSPGTRISWDRPPVVHLAFVWSGVIEAGG